MSSGKPSDKSKHFGLIDGKPIDRRGRDMGTRTQSCSTSRIWMVLAVAFFITSLALAIYVAYDKISAASKESNVVKQYPGYFRTPEEQAAVEKQMDKVLKKGTVTSAVSVKDKVLGSCDFTCQNNTFYRSVKPFRNRRSTQNHHSSLQWDRMVMTVQKLTRKRRNMNETSLGPPDSHGCCISRHKFISPDKAQSLSGSKVKVVQFSGQRQYFSSEECKHAKGCHGCGCGQEDTVVTAVVRNKEYPDDSPDEFILNRIKLPGCCKCFNNLMSP